MAGICNSSSHRGEEKALPQFRQCSGPVTSCMHACSGNGRHVIPRRNFWKAYGVGNWNKYGDHKTFKDMHPHFVLYINTGMDAGDDDIYNFMPDFGIIH